MASASSQAATSNAYAAGVATGSANTAAATSNAYAAGVATGSANAVASTPMAASAATSTTTVTTTTTYAMGVNYAAVPAGSIVINKNGGTYYLNGNTWFQPAFGANGVYYRVVSAP